MNHYTDAEGYKGIGARTSEKEWLFRAEDPPSSHPRGAYFTTLDPQTPNLSNRLRIPRRKLGYVFSFLDANDLAPIHGDRGKWIFYSADDYYVAEERQQSSGETGL